MILDLLNSETLQITDGKQLYWQKAIAMAAAPLVKNNTIETSYIEDMVDVVEQDGPYINIGPQIALAHSRPAGNVHQIGLAMLKTNQPVALIDADHPVKLWFVLAATDNTSHLAVIQELMTLLTDDAAVQQLLAAQDTATLQQIITNTFPVKP